MSKPGDITVIKIDNRYKNGNVVKKANVLRGNEQTVQITKVPNPSNPLRPILKVGHSLAKSLSK